MKISVSKSQRSRWTHHAPGHVRDMFLSAIQAYATWKKGEPEPTVEYEVNYEPHQITISQACGLLWNCRDVLPGIDYSCLQNHGVEPKSQTYAAAAQAMLRAIKEEIQK